MSEIPYIAVGNDGLGEPVGESVKCPHCGKKSTKVEYGKDKEGVESKMLGFVSCGEKYYLVAIGGKYIRR